ncbi:hypothetical protein BAUCODRAFT_575317 [Baudoinia panamericana UAMH 10762]|uniref:Uncharacterized protein n=1 Tax=Baudoinia panamericana (strain UAMH 10762) TaxID=717646 RepID=M2N0E5_BAUPA|nr:uncharacterized protein BAUCODRAFT_575317 [Baudoinia panamericana UAMH 10762]EMC97408.1 hypothetical protein BAUCODRAFT_575317 [Baudoinia panamericana UAMH 10762]
MACAPDPAVPGDTRRGMYSTAHVLLFKWAGAELEKGFCYETMAEAFNYPSYDVQQADIPEILNLDGHNGWLGSRVRELVEKLPDDSLAVIYLIDHGGSIDKVERLQVKLYHVCMLQMTLRDGCWKDVLFILDCCSAGQRQLTNSIPPPCGLLTAELIFLAGSNDGTSVDALHTTLLQDWRYRHPTDREQPEWTGNVRVLSAGDGSVVLRKLNRDLSNGEFGENDRMGGKDEEGIEKNEKLGAAQASLRARAEQAEDEQWKSERLDDWPKDDEAAEEEPLEQEPAEDEQAEESGVEHDDANFANLD